MKLWPSSSAERSALIAGVCVLFAAIIGGYFLIIGKFIDIIWISTSETRKQWPKEVAITVFDKKRDAFLANVFVTIAPTGIEGVTDEHGNFRADLNQTELDTLTLTLTKQGYKPFIRRLPIDSLTVPQIYLMERPFVQDFDLGKM